MRQARHVLEFRTAGPGLTEVTGEVADWVAQQAVEEGLLTVFLRHTSASLLIQENADPDVQRDLEAFFQRLVPEDPRLYRHGTEGPDDMPAHIKAAITATSVSVPLIDGRLALGTWQGVFLWEHRRRPHERELVVHVLGAH